MDDTEVSKLIKSKIQGLPTNQLIAISEACSELIKYSDVQIRYAEDRRAKYLAIGGTFIAASFGTILLFLRMIYNGKFMHSDTCIIIIAALGLFAGFKIILKYSSQVNYDYPFIGINNTWKWFYRDNLKILSKTKSHNKDDYLNFYKDDLSKFINNFLGVSDKSSDASYENNAAQDLGQLFLLHNNNLYKNNFLTDLKNVTGESLKFFGISSSLLLILYVILRANGI